jgi:hypothetical protein
LSPTGTTDLRLTTISSFEHYPLGELRIDQLTAPLVPRLAAQSGEDQDATIAELKSRLLRGNAIAATVPVPVVVEESNLVIDGWLSVEAYRAISLTDGSIRVPVRLFPGTELEALQKLFEAEERFPRRHTREERIAALRRFHLEHPEVPRKTVAPIFHLRHDVVSQIFNEVDELANRTTAVIRSDGTPYPAAASRPRRVETSDSKSETMLTPSREDLAYEKMLDEAAAHYIEHPAASLAEAAAELNLPIAAVEEARERHHLRTSLATLDAAATANPDFAVEQLDSAVKELTAKLKPEIATYAQLETSLAASGSHLRDHLDEATRAELVAACRSILDGLVEPD